MGFTIRIGNGDMVPTEDNEPTKHARKIDGKTIYFDTVVHTIAMPDAPSFVGDRAANTNTRLPSYDGWTEFCKDTGLHELFFNKQSGLMREHPGFAMLQPQHLYTITNALAYWKTMHPFARPGFADGHDPILARLIWLDYWVRWSYQYCENAGIYNS